MKTCKDIEDLLPIYPDGKLDASERKAVEEHLASCEACRRLLADLEETGSMIARLPDAEEPPWFQEKIMAQVRAEADKKSFAQKWFYPLRFKIPLQIAATLVIAVLAVYLYRSGNEEVQSILPGTSAPRIETQAERLPDVPKEPSPAAHISATGQAQGKGEQSLKKADVDTPGPKARAFRPGFESDTDCGNKVCTSEELFSYDAMPEERPTSTPPAALPSVAKHKSAIQAMEQTVAAVRGEESAALLILKVSDVDRAANDAENILQKSGAVNIVKEILEEKTTLRASIDNRQASGVIARLSGLGRVAGKTLPEHPSQQIRLVLEIRLP